ncbi:MAG: MFS transporter [Prevotellaceae bacterium]|jgi:MFS family permease|nr:MFS transporter [Prevotellaceae bacterium]
MEQKQKPKLWTTGYINICIANFLMACSFNLLMPSIPLYITEQLGVAQSKTGIVLSSYTIALLFVRPFSGYIVDLYSRKKVLLISFICYVGIFSGYFWATTIMMLIIVRFLHGIMWGMCSVSTSTLAIDLVPTERRAEGIGFAGTFMNVAMAIGPFIAIHIYQEQGFNTLIGYAIGMGILGIIAVSLIKAPEKPKLKREKISLDRFFLLPAWAVFLNQLLPCFAWGSIGSFVAQYGKHIGISNAGIFFLFFAAGIITSRAFSGRLVDKGYIHQVNIAAMTIVGISFFAFSILHSLYAFCIVGLFIGLGFGMMLPAMQIIYVNMAPNNKRGTANSTYLLGFDVGSSIGMLAGGFITGTWTFEILYRTSSCLCLISILVYVFVSKPVFDLKRLR